MYLPVSSWLFFKNVSGNGLLTVRFQAITHFDVDQAPTRHYGSDGIEYGFTLLCKYISNATIGAYNHHVSVCFAFIFTHRTILDWFGYYVFPFTLGAILIISKWAAVSTKDRLIMIIGTINIVVIRISYDRLSRQWKCHLSQWKFHLHNGHSHYLYDGNPLYL